jgi:hypothetical protein
MLDLLDALGTFDLSFQLKLSKIPTIKNKHTLTTLTLVYTQTQQKIKYKIIYCVFQIRLKFPKIIEIYIKG